MYTDLVSSLLLLATATNKREVGRYSERKQGHMIVHVMLARRGIIKVCQGKGR